MLDWHTPDGTSWACSPDFDEWCMFLDFKVFFEGWFEVWSSPSELCFCKAKCIAQLLVGWNTSSWSTAHIRHHPIRTPGEIVQWTRKFWKALIMQKRQLSQQTTTYCAKGIGSTEHLQFLELQKRDCFWQRQRQKQHMALGYRVAGWSVQAPWHTAPVPSPSIPVTRPICPTQS